MRSAQRRTRRGLIAALIGGLLIAGLLSACGQTGPLTLPEPDTAAADDDEDASDRDAENER